MLLFTRLKQHGPSIIGITALLALSLNQVFHSFFNLTVWPPLKLGLFIITIAWVTLKLTENQISGQDTSKKYPLHHWLPGVALVLILAAGLLLRLYHLGYLGLSTDEGSTALFSHAISISGLPCIDGECYLRGFPYLYLVSFFTGIFGSTEFWVRLPGLAITATIIPLMYFITKRLSNHSSALIVVSLVAFTDWNMMLSRYARMYNLLLLFILISIALFSHYLKKQQWWIGFLLVISSGLAMVTHQFGLLLGFISLHLIVTKRPFTIKDGFLSGGIILAAVYVLTQVPGLTYETGFQSIYSIVPQRLQSDQFWFLSNLQFPQFTYFKELFIYQAPLFSLLIGGTLARIAQLRNGGWKKIDPSINSFFYIFIGILSC